MNSDSSAIFNRGARSSGGMPNSGDISLPDIRRMRVRSGRAGFDRRQHLVGEQQTVLAIAVRSLVDFTVEELGHQVPVAALNLDGVETGLHGLLGGSAISIHNGADLQFGQHFGGHPGGRTGHFRWALWG
jgi:hypothetical protein